MKKIRVEGITVEDVARCQIGAAQSRVGVTINGHLLVGGDVQSITFVDGGIEFRLREPPPPPPPPPPTSIPSSGESRRDIP